MGEGPMQLEMEDPFEGVPRLKHIPAVDVTVECPIEGLREGFRPLHGRWLHVLTLPLGVPFRQVLEGVLAGSLTRAIFRHLYVVVTWSRLQGDGIAEGKGASQLSVLRVQSSVDACFARKDAAPGCSCSGVDDSRA